MSSKARLRVCASCEWIFSSRKHNSCPMCGFGHYSARYVYGDMAYRYQYNQQPWKEKKLTEYSLSLDQTITDKVGKYKRRPKKIAWDFLTKKEEK